jgi:hypothetical protein
MELYMLAKELRKRRKDIVCCGISEFISLIFASMIQSQKFSSVYLIPILCQPMIRDESRRVSCYGRDER